MKTCGRPRGSPHSTCTIRTRNRTGTWHGWHGRAERGLGPFPGPPTNPISTVFITIFVLVYILYFNVVKAVKQLWVIKAEGEEGEAEMQLLQRGIIWNHPDRCASIWDHE